MRQIQKSHQIGRDTGNQWTKEVARIVLELANEAHLEQFSVIVGIDIDRYHTVDDFWHTNAQNAKRDGRKQNGERDGSLEDFQSKDQIATSLDFDQI